MNNAILRLGVICSLFLTACVARGTQPLVKIGLAAPFEGLDRPLGYEALAGVKLALAERNAAGGVGGYKIELVALNDFGEPDEADLQAKEFAADPAVLGVVAGWTGETAQSALPSFRQAGLAVAVPWSVYPELADPDSGVVLVAADVQRAAGVLSGAVAAINPSRPALVGNSASAKFYAEPMSDLRLEPVVVPPPGESGDRDSQEWAAAFVKNPGQSPDALILATHGTVAGEAIQALAASDWTGATFGGVEVGGVNLVNVAGSAANGLVFVSPAPAGQDASRIDGHSILDKEALAPRAVLAYDATQVLLDAIELAIREDGSPSRRGVAAALPTVRRNGLTGDIAFDAIGRRVDAPVWLYRIEDKSYPGQLLLSPESVRGD